MRIRIVERTGSTNSDLIADPNAVEGTWLVALRQDAGKGRQGRTWVSPEGNFAGSTLVSLRDGDPPPQMLSLAAGLALFDAVDAAMPGQPLTLKWPNDLLLQGKKLAGILLERTGDRIAIGFGVNLANAPALADREAADLGGAITPEAFAPLLAASFARMLESWRTSESAALIRAWEQRAHPIGSALKVHSAPGETIAGRFAGLEADGALRLEVDGGGIEVVRAGDVDLN